MSQPLVIPRRLAIALLAEAQKAGGSPVEGLIGARDGEPRSVHPGPDAEKALSARGESLWARYCSGAAAPEGRGGRLLLVSVDTKGVLQLRCRDDDEERELKIL